MTVNIAAAPPPISIVAAPSANISGGPRAATIASAGPFAGVVDTVGPAGERGPDGPPGPPGADGASMVPPFISGSGAPSSVTGLDNQMYIDVSGGTTVMAPVWGPKTTGGWGSAPFFWVALSAVVIGTGGGTTTPSMDFSQANNSDYVALISF